MQSQDFFNSCFHIRVFVIGVHLDVQPVEVVIHKVIRTEILGFRIQEADKRWIRALPFCEMVIRILYKEFGVDTELLIDHAWGLELCGMKEIKAYKPSTNSISEGQVLSCPYEYSKARIIVQEMADSLVLQLTDKEDFE